MRKPHKATHDNVHERTLCERVDGSVLFHSISRTYKVQVVIATWEYYAAPEAHLGWSRVHSHPIFLRVALIS